MNDERRLAGQGWVLIRRFGHKDTVNVGSAAEALHWLRHHAEPGHYYVKHVVEELYQVEVSK